MEDNIVRLANEYILKSGINQLPVRLADLKRLLKKEGCIVATYGEAHDIIEKLQLQPYTSRNAFLVPVPDGNTLVLYKDTLSVGARQLALAHELGHIVLGHAHCSVLEKSFDDTAQEREAEAFARQLFAPTCVLRRMRIRTVRRISSHTLLDEEQAGIVYANLRRTGREPYQNELFKQFDCASDWSFRGLLCFAILTFSLVGFCVWLYATAALNSRAPISSDDTPIITSRISAASTTTSEAAGDLPPVTFPTTMSDAATDVPTTTVHSQRLVYVTADGEKYHTEGCQHLYRNGEMKDNLRHISEEQALAEGYTPCSVCGG